jgi:hypothetical protein
MYRYFNKYVFDNPELVSSFYFCRGQTIIQVKGESKVAPVPGHYAANAKVGMEIKLHTFSA